MSNLRGVRGVAALLSTALLSVLPTGPAAATTGEPRLRIFAASSHVDAFRYGNRAARLDAGVFISALDAALDLRVRRATYDDPITIDQVLHGSGPERVRPLPDDVLNGWRGLSEFLSVEVRDATGAVLSTQTRNFCPNRYDRQRVDDQGPVNPSFPSGCYSNPFTKGMVWGIDESWAVAAFGWRGVKLRVPDGDYEVTVTISPRYQEIFNIAPEDASVNLTVTVQAAEDSCRRCARSVGSRDSDARQSPGPEVRTMENPDPSVLPDLAPLPSWGIGVWNRRGKSHLTFGATVWVQGAASLVVEGFRRSGEDVMDAYQYFYRDGAAIGRAPAGTFAYDSRRGHQHWHFQQFAAYRLVDADGNEIVRSKKESFCLAPTDPIDLSLDGAEWNPWSVGLTTACGYPGSIWIRETLPLGWGDTYFQGIPGQSFNITDLPNGTYYIQVEANPGGLLHEQDLSNNTELREVILKGKPGQRRVVVPPWHGIDTH